MTDIFLSYRNRPARRAIVRRLATLLRNYELKVWWDYGLDAGKEYEPQIHERLREAKIVVVIWCAESVVSEWVHKEAMLAGKRLFPVRLQNVVPPPPFDKLQSHDLTHWDGSVTAPRFQKLLVELSRKLKRDADISRDTLEELETLAPVAVLPYEPLSETGGPEFDAWMKKARPVLEKFQPLYEELRWHQYEKQMASRDFVACLTELVAQMPELPSPQLRRAPSPVHRSRLLETLREFMSAELTQGQPIPDSYRIEPIVSELCLRPGVIITCWSRREGFGDLQTGLVVPLEFSNPN